jgi:phosphoribosylformylglycinamidine (FGAM) synthase-like enzyme
MDIKNNEVGKINTSQYSNALNSLLSANKLNLLESCSYSGLGGIAAALSKMCFKNSIGFFIKPIKKDLLFCENLSLIAEVKQKNSSGFEGMLKSAGVVYEKIGTTNETNKIVFANYIDTEINITKNIWQNSLRERLQ